MKQFSLIAFCTFLFCVVSVHGNSIKGRNCNTVKGEIYTNCGSRCPLTCANFNDPPICIALCVEGCFCPNGLVRNWNGYCIPPQNCPKRSY
uniref:U55-Liphistoxin-Lsp1a_2 n=1 Tax=Liphistius sp. SGP-2016 TaxID=1905180 RepID=A0A4Q8K6M9_9ARAC